MRNKRKQKMIFHLSMLFPSWTGMVSPGVIIFLLFLSLLRGSSTSNSMKVNKYPFRKKKFGDARLFYSRSPSDLHEVSCSNHISGAWGGGR